MDVLDLGATPPAEYRRSHLSKMGKKKQKLSPIATASSTADLPPKVLAQIETCEREIIQAIHLVLADQPLRHSYEWYYVSVEKLCKYKPVEQSYLSGEIKDELRRYYVEEVGTRLRAVLRDVDPHASARATSASIDALRDTARQYLAVVEQWEAKLRLMTKLFLFLDRSYLKQHPSKKMIMEEGIETLVDDIVGTAPGSADQGGTAASAALEGQGGSTDESKDSSSATPTGNTTGAAVAAAADTPQKSMLAALLYIAGALLHESRLAQFAEDAATPTARALLANLVKLNYSNKIPLNRIWIDRAKEDHDVLSEKYQRFIEPTLQSYYALNNGDADSDDAPPTYYYTMQSCLDKELAFLRECGVSRAVQTKVQTKIWSCWYHGCTPKALPLILPTVCVALSKSTRTRTSLIDLYLLGMEMRKIPFIMDTIEQVHFWWGRFLQRQLAAALESVAPAATAAGVAGGAGVAGTAATAASSSSSASAAPSLAPSLAPYPYIDRLMLLYRTYDVKQAYDIGASDDTRARAHARCSSITDFMAYLDFELRGAFASVLSASGALNSAVSAQLCSYCDSFLKKKQKEEYTGAATAAFVSTVLTVFKFLSHKSTFLIQFKRDLSRRLLFNRAPHPAVERELIAAFCSIVGDDDNEDLMSMFDDLQLQTAGTGNAEGESASTNSALARGFKPVILNKKFWPDFPAYTRLEIKLPPQLRDMIDAFTAEYVKREDKNARKVLDWAYFNYHQITLAAQFAQGRKDLTLNLLQAAIVLLFSTTATLTVGEIAAALEIDAKSASVGLASLSGDKYPILRRHGPDRAVYTFNEAFTDKASKIKVPFKGSVGTSTATPPTPAAGAGPTDPFDSLLKRKRVSETRALLVRTMKREKEIAYTALLAAAARELDKSAAPSITDIKSHIEFLIDNGYIERKGENLQYVP